jgi:hypothetical protein
MLRNRSAMGCMVRCSSAATILLSNTQCGLACHGGVRSSLGRSQVGQPPIQKSIQACTMAVPAARYPDFSGSTSHTALAQDGPARPPAACADAPPLLQHALERVAGSRKLVLCREQLDLHGPPKLTQRCYHHAARQASSQCAVSWELLSSAAVHEPPPAPLRRPPCATSACPCAPPCPPQARPWAHARCRRSAPCARVPRPRPSAPPPCSRGTGAA